MHRLALAASQRRFSLVSNQPHVHSVICSLHRTSTLAVRCSVHQHFIFQLRREAAKMQSHGFATAAPEGEEPLTLKNRLNESRSPYVSACLSSFRSYHLRPALTPGQVRGHMNNPVAWQMWTPEALGLAKKHDRLIFVSIGYAACHCEYLTPQNSSRHTTTKTLKGKCFRVSRHGT
jgi:hypothetical protein